MGEPIRESDPEISGRRKQLPPIALKGQSKEMM